MKIGIDIDGVLTDFESSWLGLGSKYQYENGLEINVNPNYYQNETLLGMNQEQIADFYRKYIKEYVCNTPIRLGAQEVVKKLKEKHKLYIITARDGKGIGEKEEKRLTQEWLRNNGICYDEMAFSCADKLSYCLENKIDCIIEDSPSNIQSLSTQIPVFCYHNFYNQQIEGKNIIRVYSWYDILSKIEKLENKNLLYNEKSMQ